MNAVSPEEAARLAALRGYRILDTKEDGSFASLTADMARSFGAPIAAVTFVDQDRQWFKAGHGLGVRETPRNWSFCAHALGREDALVVRDARLDIRFARNPLVTGQPGIRFYAGKRLLDPSGHAIGAVCVIDSQPRAEGLSDELSAMLDEFAERAMAHVELHLFRLEWIEGLSSTLLRQASQAWRSGMTEEARRLLNLVYAAADVRSAT